MNLLLTLNLGGTYTHPNVRESHIAAAARWGCQYVELVSPWGYRRPTDAFGCKLELHRYHFPPGCRVVFVDGDLIIRADCPSPLDLVPPTHMGVVANTQGEEYGDEADAVARESWAIVNQFIGRPVPFDPARYWNGGLMVFTPELHLDVWRLVELTCLSLRGIAEVGPMEEQTGMNVAVEVLNVPLHYLPATFNRMGPRAWRCAGPMPDYVLHLANIGDEFRGDKNAVLAGVEWREVPGETAERYIDELIWARRAVRDMEASTAQLAAGGEEATA